MNGIQVIGLSDQETSKTYSQTLLVHLQEPAYSIYSVH